LRVKNITIPMNFDTMPLKYSVYFDTDEINELGGVRTYSDADLKKVEEAICASIDLEMVIEGDFGTGSDGKLQKYKDRHQYDCFLDKGLTLEHNAYTFTMQGSFENDTGIILTPFNSEVGYNYFNLFMNGSDENTNPKKLDLTGKKYWVNFFSNPSKDPFWSIHDAELYGYDRLWQTILHTAHYDLKANKGKMEPAIICETIPVNDDKPYLLRTM
jgi:hypothetical protein